MRLLPKGLAHDFGQNWKNFPSLFLSIKYRKMIFLDILDRKRSILNTLVEYEFFQRG